ncbi:hypothetical protein N7G274_006264 [Stereocaulon virgatum]|uniref:Uncharacterized protein n=1 Tax=Stereocaulon virgatum TaxID=373712 RepID=A0ABR4A7C3_9LECA
MTSQSVIMSASKWEFLLRLELDVNNADHQSVYWLMKNEAINVYNAQLRNRSALRREHRNAEPPWTANQFTEDAFNAAIATIESQASARTRVLYARGRNRNGPNWVIRWILYHVCRYRDGRNKKAQSRNFHDDDELDGHGNSGGGGGGGGSGSSGAAGGVGSSKKTNAFFDTARNGYVQAQVAR